MGVSLCKEAPPEKAKKKVPADQRNSKTKVSGIGNLGQSHMTNSIEHMERSSKSKMSTISRKSDLSMYYSCVPNENSLAMNNTWLAEAGYEDHYERNKAPSEMLKSSTNERSRTNTEEIRKESINSHSSANKGDTGHNEVIPPRDQLFMSGKLKSITDRADSEESPHDKYENESEGFFEPNSFLEDDLYLKQRESIDPRKVTHLFSFGDLQTSPTSADSETEHHASCIKGIQETFGFLNFVFKQKLEDYQQIYKDKEGSRKLEVHFKTVKTQKGHKFACVQAQWYVTGKGETLIEYINTAKGMDNILPHVGTFEEQESFTDDKKQKYTIYVTSYEAELRGPMFARSYKSVGQNEWCDAFKVIEPPKSKKKEETKGTTINVGGHVISKVAGEEGKYRVKLFFETALPEDDSEALIANTLGETVQVYANSCIAYLN